MRTVLYKIRLFNDKVSKHNGKKGKESKIAERQREREYARDRGWQ